MSAEIEKWGGEIAIEKLKAIAEELAKSKLFPSVRSPAEIFAVVEYGRELGIPPVMALQSISVVKGKLCPTGQLLLAIARRHGVTWRVEKETDQECRIIFQRDNITYTSSFTIEEAKRAGLLRDDSNWAKYPKDMLFWRAVARGLRRVAPDLILGGYLPEEIEGGVIEVEPVGEEEIQREEDLPEGGNVNGKFPLEEEQQEEEGSSEEEGEKTERSEEEEHEEEPQKEFSKTDLHKMRTWISLVSTEEALEEWRREWEPKVRGTKYEREFELAYESKKKSFQKRKDDGEGLSKEDLLEEVEKLESVQEAADWLRKRKRHIDALENGDRNEIFKAYQDRLRSLS